LVWLALTGCQPQAPQDSDWETRLYAVSAGAGQFVATGDPRVYTLTTRQVDDSVTWFADLPLRQAGTLTLAAFMAEVWPDYFAHYHATATVGVRSADGVWSILPAQVQAAVHDARAGTLTWTLRLEGTPDTVAQSGVVVYLDDEGARGRSLPGYGDSFVFSHAAAQAHLQRLAGETDYRLTLSHPLPTFLMTTVAPAFDAALVPVVEFVEDIWATGFAQDPPNAALTLEGPDGRVQTLALTLSEPHWDATADTLSFRARPLGAAPATASGPAMLYIDSYRDTEENRVYRVVVNREEQYSIWPADRELPLGWNATGEPGTKEVCLAYIAKVWTDMRPLSLRKMMEEMGRERPLPPPA
jgi:MbtH protein